MLTLSRPDREMRSLAALGLVLTSTALLASSTYAVEAPGIAPEGDLSDVAMVSGDDGWAVGKLDDATLALHWDGRRWQRVATPSPGAYGAELTSVTALSADDVWAVGRYDDPGYTRQLIEHWDGLEWSKVPGAELQSHGVYLLGVHGDAPNDVWAVGFDDIEDGLLVEHWDGTDWSVAPLSRAARHINGVLRGVSAVSPTDVWAVGDSSKPGSFGRTLSLHWDGERWDRVPTPGRAGVFSALWDVDALDGDHAWTVVVNDQGHQLIAHREGPAWVRDATTPVPGASPHLYGVDAVTPTDVWAVGRVFRPHGASPLAEHWDGISWSQIEVPSLPDGEVPQLRAVAAVTSTDVWAAGYTVGGTQAPLLHWDGHDWKPYRPSAG